MYRLILKLGLRMHRFFFDRLMHHVAPRCFGGNHPKNVFHYRSEFFLENVSSDDVVMDLACGQGTIIKNLAPKIRQGLGVEMNPRQLSLARKNSPGNVEFAEGDIYGDSVARLIKSAGVTKIVLSHILEHLPDGVSFLKKLQERELLICVPSQENWYRQLLKSLDLPYMSDPTHFREYTRTMLAEELKAAGYRPIFLGFNAEGEIVCRAVHTA